MNSRTLLNIGMVFAAMAAAIVLRTYQSEDIASAAHTLVPVPQAEISSIEIDRIKSPKILLQRTGAQWAMTAPVKSRLDETALALVLDLSRLGASNALAATDLTKYGLDQPWARISFGGHALEFGNTNTVTEELYVRSGNSVHAVSARNASAIPSSPGKLIAHRMFSPEEVLVAIHLPGFSLRHDGVRWQMDPPDAGLSQDDLVRWIEQWRYASSIITEPGETPTKADASIELRGGRKLDISVKARTPDLVLHRHDEGLDYHFNARMTSLLLSSPSATPNQSR